MKKYFTYSLVLLLSMAIHKGALGQNRRAPSINFGLQVVQPIGEFADTYDGMPVGMAGTFTAPLALSPIELGIGIAWNSMGSQSEDITAFIGTDESGDSIYDEGNMRIRSNTHRFQLVARFKPFKGGIQPYVDGVIGAETFKTKSEVTIDGNGYSEETSSVRQHFDMSFSYGYAVGLRFRVGSGVFLDARFENLSGGISKYVDRNTIQVVNENTITFETHESRTDKFTYQLGFAVNF
jgi:hypothetical protein